MRKIIHIVTFYKSYGFEGVRGKRAFFVFRPSSQDQKGLPDTNKFLTPLACEILFKQFLLFLNINFKFYFILI